MRTTLQANDKTVIFTDNHKDALRIDKLKSDGLESFQWIGYIDVPLYMPQTQYVICTRGQYRNFANILGYKD